MRPLLLKISGFGPYAGETLIPMQELGDKGLYLITGDTGAGKTTIFDAICYALYGEASGESRDVSMLRSKYAEPDTPTEVDLTFSHNGKEYRVVRNPEYERPAKRGEGVTKQTANACLYLPDGNTVTKLKDVTATVENLLGINRDQFSQISMIAQGDFKKLLLADTKQRQEIFRELFKTGYYQKLQNALENKRKEIYGEVEDGKKSVNQYISGMSADEDDVLSIEVEKAKNGQLTMADILELLDKLISHDSEIKKKAENDLEDINKALQEINENIGAAETINKTKTALEEAEKQLEEAKPSEDRIKAAFEEARSKLAKKDEYTRNVVEIEAEIEKFDNINKIKAEIKRADEAKINIEKEIENAIGKKNEKEESLKNIKAEHNSIKDVSGEIEKYNNELGKIRELEVNLDELKADNESYLKEKEQLAGAQEKYKKDDAIYQELCCISECMEKAFRDGQAGILAESLVEGECCPVCGSTTHPAKAVKTADIPSESEINQAKKKTESARNVAASSSEEAGKRKTAVELKEAELIKKAEKILGTDIIDNIAELISERKAVAATEEAGIVQKIKEEKAKAARKFEIEQMIPSIEDEIKKIDEGITSGKERLSSLNTKVVENRKQLEELQTGLTFESKESAEKNKSELKRIIEEIQKNYEKADYDQKQINELIVALLSKIENCRKTLEGAKVIDLSDEMAKKRSAEDRQNKCIAVLKTVGSRQDANISIRDNIVTQSAKIAEKEKELQWVAALADTANGKLRGKEKLMLETYVQTTYFDRIIERANLRFMTMSGGQYELKRQVEATNSKSQSGLELSVIDHYNGSERSVKTLSGGESFMASLSLALGLSDEVQSSAGGIKVDTMFVDEGFGSLDSESLDQAYRALAGLTEGNRLVGIISHVAELKTKIDSQIIVKKEKSGGSFVSIQV